VLKRKWIDTSFSAKQKRGHANNRIIKPIAREMKVIEKLVKDMVRESQHFVLPSDSEGEAIIKGYDGDYSDVLNESTRLPYPSVTISFQHKGVKKFVVVREEVREDLGTIWVLFIPKSSGKHKWETPLATIAILPAKPKENHVRWLSDVYGEAANTWEKSDELKQACLNVCTEEVYAIYELLIRLQTHEVEVKNRDYRRAPQVRGGGERKILPVHEYRELMIRSVERMANGGGDGYDCLPSTPKREHHRRGHQRHLKSGKIVWVRDCVVGDRSKGVIVKEYKLGDE
jgi:hypothetical protein